MTCSAHGLSAHKLLALDVYATRYVAEGYACVVFDYRRWGASGLWLFEFVTVIVNRSHSRSPAPTFCPFNTDGTPRHVLRVSEQLEDYRTVINWTRQRPELDKNRIILWGTSFSGS